MMDVGGWRFKVKKLFILNPTSSPMRERERDLQYLGTLVS